MTPEQARTFDTELEGKVQSETSVEALSWLRGAGEGLRSISGGGGSDDMLANEEAATLVQELYECGAEKVTAADVSGYLEQEEHQDTDTLIIHLPQDQKSRDNIFEVVNAFVEERGWEVNPDTGQRYLMMWWE